MGADFTVKLEHSKLSAEKTIRESMAAIEKDLRESVINLRNAGQRTALEVEVIIAALNRARDEWLQYEKSAFDSAILSLKNRLYELNAQD